MLFSMNLKNMFLALRLFWLYGFQKVKILTRLQIFSVRMRMIEGFFTANAEFWHIKASFYQLQKFLLLKQ